MDYSYNHITSLLRAFEGLAREVPKEVAETKRKAGQYEYIPLPENQFLDQLHKVKLLLRKKVPTFIDVGCGIGSKVFLAQGVLGSCCCGIEITKSYVKVARELTKQTSQEYHFGKVVPELDDEQRIIHGDALAHSYAPYNVIYFFCPLTDHLLQRELEERIVATAKRGAFILANLPKHFDLWKSKKVLQWDEHIYQKRGSK